MSGFTLLHLDEVDSEEVKKRASIVALETEKNCGLIFEWDEMFNRYVIFLSKFKLEEPLYLAAKVNIMHTSRLKHGLNIIMKHIEDNGLTHLIKKSENVYYSFTTFLTTKNVLYRVFF